MINIVPWNAGPKLGDVAIAIISLDEAHLRREKLIERGLMPEWVNGYWPATDMRSETNENIKLNPAHVKMKKTYGRDILPGELGCMLSHNAVIKWFANKCEASLIIILEDDVLSLHSDFLNRLLSYVSYFEEESKHDYAFMCHLGLSNSQWENSFSRRIYSKQLCEKGLDLYHHFNKKDAMWMAHAYLMSKEAAVRYSQSPYCLGYLADDWKRIANKSSFKLLSVGPGFFLQDDMLSSFIDPKEIRSKSNKVKGVSYYINCKVTIRKFFINLIQKIVPSKNKIG